MAWSPSLHETMILDRCAGIPWSSPWLRDDFDPCFRQLFVEKAVPGVIVAVSFTVLTLALLRHNFDGRGRVRTYPDYPSLLGERAAHLHQQNRRPSQGYGGRRGSNQSVESTSDNEDDNEFEHLLRQHESSENSLAHDAQSQNARTLPSIRDILLVTLTVVQAALCYFMRYSRKTAGGIAAAEVALWAWAVLLCVYLLYRRSITLPSPSPHLRLVYLAGFMVDFVRARTALLLYSRGKVDLPYVEIAMASVAAILLVASLTQQRRRHGRPSNATASASDAYPQAPETTASVSQLLFFSWMDPMIWLGYKRPLEPKDVYDLMPQDHSAFVCAHWKRKGREYAYRNGGDNRSITLRLFWFFRYRLALQCVWTLGNTIFIFTGPFLLKRILAYMEDPTIYTHEQAFWCVAGLFVGGTISTVCQSQALWIGRKIGLQIKSIIIGEVYAKSLRRRDAANEGSGSVGPDAGSKDGENKDGDEDESNEATSTGKITNLMAVDANKISEISAYLHFLYYLPAEVVITVMMLYQLLGMASIAGLCTLMALIPIQWWVVNVWSTYQKQLMKASDKRMSITNEILQGVRIIKFFAWEPQFEKQVATVRNGELGVLRKRYLILTVSIIIFFMAPVFITLTTFAVYTKVMGMQLTASVAFTALALFKTLRAPIDQLPDFISFTLQAKVSLDRVSKFLSEEETPKYKLSKLARNTHEGAIYGGDRRASFAEVVGATDIGFVNASFSWKSAASATSAVTTAVASTENLSKAYSETDPLLSADSGQNTAARPSTSGSNDDHSSGFELQGLTVSFPVGKLSIIAGPTGCGKTSLLMALLGEMRLIAGQVMIPGALFRSHTDMPGEDTPDAFASKESVAYVAQQAWLLNDTIRGNIIFGLPYDEQRYCEVVRMCALTRDFEILEAGDMTEVGERGVALSGGQKQRICLARAVYSPARHVVMDDCLSAVDAHTAKHLYDNCLMSPYMSERTRILVTHAVGLTIKGASTVVVMQDGHIAASGTPQEVLRSGKLSEETLREADETQQNAAARAEAGLDDKGKAVDVETGDNSGSADNTDSKTIDKRFDGIVGGRDTNTRSTSKDASQKNDSQKGKLTTEEDWSRGHVEWRVYLAYLRASGGILFWAILTVLFLLTQGLQVAQDWWLREWAASYSRPVVPVEHTSHTYSTSGITISPLMQSVAGSSPAALLASSAVASSGNGASVLGGDSGSSKGVDLAYFIGVYVAIALASILIISGRSLLQFWGSLKASKILHESLLHTVLRAPVRFFDTTPVGRLINRFSKDMETIDHSLNSSLAIFLTELIASFAILIVIAVITPAFTIGAVIVAAIYWVIGVLYLSTSREIKRFESVTKSPIYTQFGETINGVSTIRAYGQEARFRAANHVKVDDNNRPFIYMWGANRWLSIRVDLAGALVSFMAGLLALMATGRMDAGLAGLSLSYALNFTEHILWVVRFYSINEMNLNSVERVVEYLDIEPEAPVSIPDRVPPSEWPAHGQITVEDLELKYAENQPAVIRGISFNVQPCEKVGIVGRTGAGKSTLTLAMFRFMEASAGRIMIDGIDISQIGVGDLRSRLTIIPQDPILFTGTIRSNLDPFNEHGDDELWLALRRAHLLGDDDSASTRPTSRNGTIGESATGALVATAAADDAESASCSNSHIAVPASVGSQAVVTLGRTITDLEMVVTENGSNFSQGQRQLIALARALVKRTRVIILDEATASVDFDTDAKIQTTIRNEFTDSTLLCIAHRLRTIVDYDKVLVLDQGQVVEYDTPYNLLKRSDGLFKHMCMKSGEYDHLFSAAERKHHLGDSV
ncbi:Transporter of the ATP-binding cassette (ABC) [Coemansia erecta]|uniref:Transporter of the ATP-binding cassette (ABC) n=1 Tax=Coemansia erecta TaxID=147472 RepID=A0A9W7Y7U4_9FUNG|nr:Transporter of the ATP-binding cassette (ABC) [Coemansia erecta]